MAEKQLISPSFRATIGQYVLTEGMEIECFSSRESHNDWCKVEISNMLQGMVTFEDMTDAVIELGYEEDYDTIIQGYVRLTSKDYWKEIIIKDDMIKLERTYITATFIDCTPQDVIKYALGMAGIENYKLSSNEVVQRRVFSIANKNAIDTIKEVNSSWNIDYSFYFSNKCFYWGSEELQDMMYVLEEGINILKLQKFNELWEIETIAIPWIHHSQKIAISHSKYSGTVTVQKTIIRSDKNGFIRMYIYFKGGI